MTGHVVLHRRFLALSGLKVAVHAHTQDLLKIESKSSNSHSSRVLLLPGGFALRDQRSFAGSPPVGLCMFAGYPLQVLRHSVLVGKSIFRLGFRVVGSEGLTHRDGGTASAEH